MLLVFIATVVFAAGTAAGPAAAEEEVEESKELEAGKQRLQECRQLFSDGKQDEAMELAQRSLDILVAPYPELRNVGIGTLDTEQYRIEVHVNTSKDERAHPKPPITRPYSFLVYSKGEDSTFLYALDFEHGHDDGKLRTAALGRMHGGHFNYGMVPIEAEFSEVKERALEVIKLGIETGK